MGQFQILSEDQKSYVLSESLMLKEVLVWVSVVERGTMRQLGHDTMLATEEHPDVTWKCEVFEDMNMDLILLSQ